MEGPGIVEGGRPGEAADVAGGLMARAATIAQAPEWYTVMRKTFCSEQAYSWVRRILAALKSAVS